MQGLALHPLCIVLVSIKLRTGFTLYNKKTPSLSPRLLPAPTPLQSQARCLGGLVCSLQQKFGPLEIAAKANVTSFS